MAEINLMQGQINANGTTGNDILRGSVDSNVLTGDGGDDQLWGGCGGNDTMTGSAGADGFWWDKNDGNDVIAQNGDASKDALLCYESSYNAHSGYYNGAGDLVVVLNNSNNNVTIANWQNMSSNQRMQNFVFKENGMSVDYLWNAGQSCEVNLYDAEFSLSNVHKAICVDSATATMRGSAGDDYLQGGSGNDQIWGGQSGLDTLAGGAGSDQYWWGTGNSGNVLIKDDVSNSQDTLYLYNLNASQIKTTTSGNNLVISSGSNSVIIENGVNDKIGAVKFADGSTISGDQLLTTASRDHHLNIKFDYSMDVNGWFTDRKKAVLEQAARVWTDHIIADLPEVLAGNSEDVYELSHTYAYDYGNGNIMQIPYGRKRQVSTSGYDDFIIYVGTVSDSSNDNYSGITMVNSRHSSIGFNQFSSQNATEAGFLKVAEHEIGHALGLSYQYGGTFANLETNSNGTYYFNGANAKALNGGAPIQMWDMHHPNNNYVSAVMGYGPNVTSVTNMDLAMLKDIGWNVV